MSTGLPHYRQEKKNICALACLRMVLAAFGTDVEEGMLQVEAHMETDGTEIAELERLAMAERTPADRLSDSITRVAGSSGFVTAHAIGFTVWISTNLGAIPGLGPFDPFPFSFLTLVVSLEAIFLAIFVLMSGVAMIGILYFGRDILLPFALSVLLTFLLAPLVNRLERWHLARVPAVLISIGVSFAAISLLAYVLLHQLYDLAYRLPEYESNITSKIDALRGDGNGVLARIGKRTGLTPGDL